MKLGMQVGLGPGHIVLHGHPAPPPPKGGPNLRPISVVARPISATADHLLYAYHLQARHHRHRYISAVLGSRPSSDVTFH